jgi:hypothetical protein
MAITTVILVHGAWHGAWCWQPLIPELLKRRLAPFTLDLPAHGVHARFPEGWGDDPRASPPRRPLPASPWTMRCSRRRVRFRPGDAGRPQHGGIVADDYLAAFMPLPVPMIDYVRCAECRPACSSRRHRGSAMRIDASAPNAFRRP